MSFRGSFTFFLTPSLRDYPFPILQTLPFIVSVKSDSKYSKPPVSPFSLVVFRLFVRKMKTGNKVDILEPLNRGLLEQRFCRHLERREEV